VTGPHDNAWLILERVPYRFLSLFLEFFVSRLIAPAIGALGSGLGAGVEAGVGAMVSGVTSVLGLESLMGPILPSLRKRPMERSEIITQEISQQSGNLDSLLRSNAESNAVAQQQISLLTAELRGAKERAEAERREKDRLLLEMQLQHQNFRQMEREAAFRQELASTQLQQQQIKQQQIQHQQQGGYSVVDGETVFQQILDAAARARSQQERTVTINTQSKNIINGFHQ